MKVKLVMWSEQKERNSISILSFLQRAFLQTEKKKPLRNKTDAASMSVCVWGGDKPEC